MRAAPARRRSSTVVFVVLALSVSSYGLIQAIMVPALPAIRADLGASAASVTWLLTGFLISAAVVTPIAGNLGDLFGKRRVLIATLVTCSAGALIATLATTVAWLIAGRVLQGVVGAVFPLAFAIARDAFAADRVQPAIAVLSTIMGVGGVLGIVLAGPIVEAVSFRALFWLPLVLLLVALIGAVMAVPASAGRPGAEVDWGGAGLLAGWLTILLVGISAGGSWGWGSGRQLAAFAAAAILALAWIAVERRVRQPMVDLRLMRTRAVWMANAAALMYGYCLFTALIVVPQFVQLPVAAGYGFGASVSQAGLFLAPSTIALVIVGLAMSRVMRHLRPRGVLIAGACVSGVAFAGLAFAHGEAWHLYLTSACLGVGNALCFAALPNLIVDAVPPADTGTATGVNMVARSVGGALGSQVSTAIVVSGIATTGYPREGRFTLAFAVGLIVAGAIAALAVAMPAGRGRRGAAVPTDAAPV